MKCLGQAMLAQGSKFIVNENDLHLHRPSGQPVCLHYRQQRHAPELRRLGPPPQCRRWQLRQRECRIRPRLYRPRAFGCVWPHKHERQALRPYAWPYALARHRGAADGLHPVLQPLFLLFQQSAEVY